MKELVEVVIPHHIAEKEGVAGSGTIVWHVPGAALATVECAATGGDPGGLETRLVDVEIGELRLL